MSFVVSGRREAAWRVVDSTRTISITANLGDAKSTVAHPASTSNSYSGSNYIYLYIETKL